MPQRSTARPIRKFPAANPNMVRTYGTEAVARLAPNSACISGNTTTVAHIPMLPTMERPRLIASLSQEYALSCCGVLMPRRYGEESPTSIGKALGRAGVRHAANGSQNGVRGFGAMTESVPTVPASNRQPGGLRSAFAIGRDAVLGSVALRKMRR